ncbi:hypothetical protein GEMRC1_005215 [Eukaryota sp. GEM-RC1]
MSKRLSAPDNQPRHKQSKVVEEDLHTSYSLLADLLTAPPSGEQIVLDGFPTEFSSTKSKHVFGNVAYAVDIKTKRKYRQFVHKKRNFQKVEGEVIKR